MDANRSPVTKVWAGSRMWRRLFGLGDDGVDVRAIQRDGVGGGAFGSGPAIW